jgi:hypothetical protein
VLINRTFFITIITTLILGFYGTAQEGGERIPLDIVLGNLQEQYGYNFNYAQDLIENISIEPPSKDLNIQDVLEYLKKETGLDYTLLGNNFISLNRKSTLLLCGYLKDIETQEPLTGATILGDKNSAISNEEGYFELTAENENDKIEIRFLGYNSIQREFKYFKRDRCESIFMISQEEMLSEVVLSGYIVNGIHKLNDGSFTIDFSRFSILPGLVDADVLFSMQSFPGVQSINETVSNINIRGGTHDQNLILWDGIKMYQSGNFFGLISLFNPQMTQKVSLKKNGTEARFTDGVSGTISMETDRQVNSRLNGSLGLTFLDANGFIDVPLGDNSSLQIAARKSLNDLVTTPTYTEYFDRISQQTEVVNNSEIILNSDQEFDFYDTSLRWLYRISDKDEVQLNFINTSNKLVFNENAMIDEDLTSRESSLSQRSIAGGVHYKRTWNDDLKTSLHIYETDYKLKAINVNVLNEQRFLQENVVSETGVKMMLDYTLNEQIQLNGGYNFIETKVTNLDDVDSPLFRSLVSEVVRSHSGFAQIGYRSAERNTSIVLGSRVNYLDKFEKIIIEPRFSLNHRFLEYFNISLLGEFKHQITSHVINSQNDFLGIEKRRWQLSNNAEIPIIMSKQGSFSLSYSQDGWLFDGGGYLKNVEGITSQSQGFLNQYEFVKEEGSYLVTGLDIFIRKKLRRTNFWLSYSYMDNNYTFDQLSEKEFPSNFDITHAVTFGTALEINNFKIAAGFNWHTGKPITIPVLGNEIIDNTINYDDPNDTRLDDYFRVDLSATYNYSINERVKLKAGISIWNLLGQENIIERYYKISNDGLLTEVSEHSLGLTPNALLRIQF